MIYTPPQNIAKRSREYQYVFLAGSIGANAELTELCKDWQTDMAQYFLEMGIGSFNPRRKDWNNSWTQEFENPQFYQQVNWELDALERADHILLYLVPETMSPISLLELGLHASDKNLYVVCPNGFWRKGNVDIVCNKYNIPLFESLDEFKKHFHEKIRRQTS